jgi:lipid-A-disaccharide synthase
LFPGSRKQEIRKHLPILLESARILKERFPDLQFILPLASSLDRSDVAPYLDSSGMMVTLVEGQGHDVIQVCDAIISVSGTVTLEVALLGVPLVLIYRVSPLTYLVAKWLIRVDHVGLCNIVADKRVVREMIQYQATPEGIAEEIARILSDSSYAEEIRTGLALVRKRLGSGGCSARVAGIVQEMLQ